LALLTVEYLSMKAVKKNGAELEKEKGKLNQS
jgi:hypothetical protein